MTETKINDGEWRAVIADVTGWVADTPEEIDAALADPGSEQVSIRRGSALPDEEGHCSGDNWGQDVFMEIDLEDLDADVRREFYGLALKAAWGMNQDPEAVMAWRDLAVALVDADPGPDKESDEFEQAWLNMRDAVRNWQEMQQRRAARRLVDMATAAAGTPEANHG